METEQVEKMENFLRQFRLIKEKYDAVARVTGENFNVFSILGMESREIRHSALLAELLNPNGSHDQGAVFLRLFFEMLREDCESQFKWELSETELAQFSVIAEADSDDGRIDILIEKDDKCVVIENKIYAGDQERQLGKYYDYAKKKYEDENIVVIYLTLAGNEPGKYTLGKELDKKKVLQISYKKHIIKWLNICLKEVARLPYIRETLFQYQFLLKKLTNQTHREEFFMETNDLFSKNENYKLILSLRESMKKFEESLPIRLWPHILKAIDEKEDFFKQYVRMKDNGNMATWKIFFKDDINVIVRIQQHWQTPLCFYLVKGLELQENEGTGYLDNPNREIIRNYRHDHLDESCRKYLKAALQIDGMKKWTEALCTFRESWNCWLPSNEEFVQKMTDETGGKKLAEEIVDKIERSIRSFLENI